MSFNVNEYRDALKMLKDSIDEMEGSMEMLEFEHGEGGISSRAEVHANELEGSLTEAFDNLATVRVMIDLAKEEA